MRASDKTPFHWNRLHWSRHFLCLSSVLKLSARARVVINHVSRARPGWAHYRAPDHGTGHRVTIIIWCPVVWYFNYIKGWPLSPSIVPWLPCVPAPVPSKQGVGLSSIKIGGKASRLWRDGWRGSVWTWRMPSLFCHECDDMTRWPSNDLWSAWLAGIPLLSLSWAHVSTRTFQFVWLTLCVFMAQ